VVESATIAVTLRKSLKIVNFYDQAFFRLCRDFTTKYLEYLNKVLNKLVAAKLGSLIKL
jgi:hypothetical protein